MSSKDLVHSALLLVNCIERYPELQGIDGLESKIIPCFNSDSFPVVLSSAVAASLLGFSSPELRSAIQSVNPGNFSAPKNPKNREISRFLQAAVACGVLEHSWLNAWLSLIDWNCIFESTEDLSGLGIVLATSGLDGIFTLCQFESAVAKALSDRILDRATFVEFAWLFCVLSLEKSKTFLELIQPSLFSDGLEQEDASEWTRRQVAQINTHLGIPTRWTEDDDHVEEDLVRLKTELVDHLVESEGLELIHGRRELIYRSDATFAGISDFIFMDFSVFPDSDHPMDPFSRLKLEQLVRAGFGVRWFNGYSWKEKRYFAGEINSDTTA